MSDEAVMSPEEFARRVQELREPIGDGYFAWVESAHIQADELALTVLRQLGYGAGVDLIEQMPRWYA